MKGIDRIITESINKVLNEAFQSNILRDLHKKTPSEPLATYHGGKDFGHKTMSDSPAYGVTSPDGMDSGWFLDKITDDMIEAVGTYEELRKKGYRLENGKVVNYDGEPKYAMRLWNQKAVIFNSDPETIKRLKMLSSDAGKRYKARRDNKRADGANRYQWSTWERGNAFDEWKNTGRALWDNPEFRKEAPNVSSDWRKNSWVKRNMDKALSSYRRKKS